ncbi:MAG TPA: tetraacyldisaccharide 4'-kinase [Chthoniobacterales bacterium]|jgi:tetraacyldisaccharide 4'-kinase|nr:tetraacyldisaccharide 4'-kinase [Chthoniobacterales bacterium]
MRRWIEGIETFAIDVILERRYGRRADILRWILKGLSHVYRLIVQARLALYRKRIYREHVLGCPVVSVGNITVGGTGKTPVVELLARELTAGGRKVAILSRGYKSVPKPLFRRLLDKIFRKKAIFTPRIVSDGQSLLLDSRTAGDEPFMLANNLRGVVVLVDRDRVKSGLYAIEHFGADTLLLDDGFQYVRLDHRMEVTLIDRQAPFGNEHILPRGTLREPPANLRRATHILLTKCVPGEDNSALIARIRKYNRTAEIVETTHHARHLRNLLTGEIKPLESLRGLRIGSLCGIAAPDSFEGALKMLGAKIEISKTYTDHHRYTDKEIEGFINRCARRNLDAILTTEKDAVRIPRILDAAVPIYYLRVEIEILKGEDNWRRLIEKLTNRQPVMTPAPVFV